MFVVMEGQNKAEIISWVINFVWRLTSYGAWAISQGGPALAPKMETR